MSEEPLISGGHKRYVRIGVIINMMMPTGAAAKNQLVQLTVAMPAFAANSTANGFGAIPVRKIVLETQVVAKLSQVRYAPILRGFLSG